MNLYFDLPFYYFLQFLSFPSLEEVKHGKVFGYFLYIKDFLFFDMHSTDESKSNKMA